ncbi:MAG TPA: enolase C-terminal domain-like protein, partial [Terriglobales bacterium]|nr:enolase C-terminal domain-like protein [Terriglobales bacterium]
MDARIERLDVSAYTVPTDGPESDGTLEWDSTTLVLVELHAGGRSGLGFTYADSSLVKLIREKLEKIVVDSDALALPQTWQEMLCKTRNLGRPGLVSMAIAAVDVALWDLKARLLELPLLKLLGQVRRGIPAYGSGGFTSYTPERLKAQMSEWAQAGLTAVKMKIGREPAKDPTRVQAARQAIGPGPELFVDANGAYTPNQAQAQALRFAEQGVTWFEEPVTSDALEDLHHLRGHLPAGMRVAAGEYGYDNHYFRQMLEGRAVDVLQADATRCAGITGFLQASVLCDAFLVPLSAHTAPSIHQHACCAASRACNVEYFYDH